MKNISRIVSSSLVHLQLLVHTGTLPSAGTHWHIVLHRSDARLCSYPPWQRPFSWQMPHLVFVGGCGFGFAKLRGKWYCFPKAKCPAPKEPFVFPSLIFIHVFGQFSARLFFYTWRNQPLPPWALNSLSVSFLTLTVWTCVLLWCCFQTLRSSRLWDSPRSSSGVSLGKTLSSEAWVHGHAPFQLSQRHVLSRQTSPALDGVFDFLLYSMERQPSARLLQLSCFSDLQHSLPVCPPQT